MKAPISSNSLDFRILFEAMPNAYLILSPDLKIVAASDAFLNATFSNRNELEGRYFVDTLPLNARNDKAVEVLTDSFRKVIETKKPDLMIPQRHDVQLRVEDGGGFEERHWQMFNSPVLGKNGEVEFIIHWVEDITEFILIKKERKEDADKYTRDLEAINELLITTNKQLEQFAYLASHDLQEPLRTISSYIKLLEKRFQEYTNKEVDKYFKFITKAAAQMQNLIKELLEFSVIGKNVEHRVVDCNKLLKEIIAEMHSSIQESNALISCPTLPTVYGSESELKRLFQNLLSNSIKYRKHDVTAEIRIDYEENEKEFSFKVSDNGIGIEDKNISKLFIIFQRLHSKAEYPGTGIGLATCAKIVQLHGGKIWVESELGVGSKFYFTLSKEKHPN